MGNVIFSYRMAKKSTDTDAKISHDIVDVTTQEPNATQEVAPEFINAPIRDGYNVAPAYTSNQEWEEDQRSLGKARHDALNGFLEATVIQRSNLLRDLLAVSVTILFGALTLYFADISNIKTLWLFYFGLAILVTGIVVNLISRSAIIKHLQDVSHQIEKAYLDLFEASREVMKNPSQYNIDAVYRIENSQIIFSSLTWIGEHGHRLVIWSLVICVISLGLSVILTLSL